MELSASVSLPRSCLSGTVYSRLRDWTAVEVIQPSLPVPWLTTPICALAALNLFMHYYYVCTVTPGFVTDPPRQQGSGILWASRRLVDMHLTGVRWSDDVRITEAAKTRCQRCREMRPEVRFQRSTLKLVMQNLLFWPYGEVSPLSYMQSLRAQV